MIQFTLTYTSLNGNIPWSSTDIVEGINFAIQNLSEIECEESSLMQMLLLILGDRLDLAESAYNRMVRPDRFGWYSLVRSILKMTILWLPNLGKFILIFVSIQTIIIIIIRQTELDRSHSSH